MPKAPKTDPQVDYPESAYQPLPNKEAIVAFNGKALLTSESYLDVKAYQHALAFTVAGLMDEDLLKETRDAIASALENGTDFRTFKQRLKPYLMSKGWLAETLDDGTQKMAVGSNRRLRTIYSTNLQSAYSAGQWSRIQQTKEFLPYLQYMPSVSENPRLSHKKYYGLCRPADDPIWTYIMPQNGWGCKCWVKQLTKKQAQKVGISDEKPLETQEYVNPKTGEKSQIPVGIDPSFVHNHDPITAVLRLAEDRHGKEFADKLKKQAEKLLPDTLPIVPVATVAEPLPPPEQWQDVAKTGEEIYQKHSDLFADLDLDKEHSFANALLELMQREGVETGATVVATGDNVNKVTEILKRYPASWIKKANDTGMTYVRNMESRGYQYYIPDDRHANYFNVFIADKKEFKPFEKFAGKFKAGDSFLKLNNMAGKQISNEAYDITIHEFAHRLQATMPELDEYFKQLWISRTKGEKTRPLAVIQKERGEWAYYDLKEVGRKDNFTDVYFGRNYGTDDNPKPLELLTMTMQVILGNNIDKTVSLKNMLAKDPEMIYLAIALLTRFKP